MKRLIESRKPHAEFLTSVLDAREKVYADLPEMADWYENYASIHKNRLAYDLQYLVTAYPDSNGVEVLELGSVPPILNLAIKNHGFEITGLDIEPDRFGSCIAENNLDIRKGIIGNGALPFSDNSFDAIIMNEVFEHLNTNLIEVISEIKRIMKPNGRLFLSTPNLRSMVGIKNFLLHGKAYSCCGELYEEYDKIYKYGHMGHVREYTPNEVQLFLSKLGLPVEKLIYRGKYPAKYRIIESVFPRLKPFFSVVAVKT